jgi:hypothetical protein
MPNQKNWVLFNIVQLNRDPVATRVLYGRYRQRTAGGSAKQYPEGTIRRTNMVVVVISQDKATVEGTQHGKHDAACKNVRQKSPNGKSNTTK